MLTEDHITFVKGLATVIAAADTETQLVFINALAQGMNQDKLDALWEEVVQFATEEESVALCQLARALNERDGGLVTGAPC